MPRKGIFGSPGVLPSDNSPGYFNRQLFVILSSGCDLGTKMTPYGYYVRSTLVTFKQTDISAECLQMIFVNLLDKLVFCYLYNKVFLAINLRLY